MNYYRITFPQDSTFGSATSISEEIEKYDFRSGHSIENWEPPVFLMNEGNFSDYQGSTPLFRLCSKKMKDIIDSEKSQDDEIQWFRINIQSKYDISHEYYILHFPIIYDVLDWDKSITVPPKTVVKPVFSKKKVQNHKVFCFPNSGKYGLIISESIRNALVNANCTNLSISRVPLVD